MSSPQSKQYSADDFLWYASISGDKDMYTERPHYGEGIAGSEDWRRIPARGFIAIGAGDIEIRPIWGAAAGTNDQTITVSVGQWYPLQFKTIVDAGTTVTNLLVIW